MTTSLRKECWSHNLIQLALKEFLWTKILKCLTLSEPKSCMTNMEGVKELLENNSMYGECHQIITCHYSILTTPNLKCRKVWEELNQKILYYDKEVHNAFFNLCKGASPRFSHLTQNSQCSVTG